MQRDNKLRIACCCKVYKDRKLPHDFQLPFLVQRVKKVEKYNNFFIVRVKKKLIVLRVKVKNKIMCSVKIFLVIAICIQLSSSVPYYTRSLVQTPTSRVEQYLIVPSKSDGFVYLQPNGHSLNQFKRNNAWLDEMMNYQQPAVSTNIHESTSMKTSRQVVTENPMKMLMSEQNQAEMMKMLSDATENDDSAISDVMKTIEMKMNDESSELITEPIVIPDNQKESERSDEIIEQQQQQQEEVSEHPLMTQAIISSMPEIMRAITDMPEGTASERAIETMMRIAELVSNAQNNANIETTTLAAAATTENENINNNSEEKIESTTAEQREANLMVAEIVEAIKNQPEIMMRLAEEFTPKPEIITTNPLQQLMEMMQALKEQMESSTLRASQGIETDEAKEELQLTETNDTKSSSEPNLEISTTGMPLRVEIATPEELTISTTEQSIVLTTLKSSTEEIETSSAENLISSELSTEFLDLNLRSDNETPEAEIDDQSEENSSSTTEAQSMSITTKMDEINDRSFVSTQEEQITSTTATPESNNARQGRVNNPTLFLHNNRFYILSGAPEFYANFDAFQQPRTPIFSLQEMTPVRPISNEQEDEVKSDIVVQRIEPFRIYVEDEEKRNATQNDNETLKSQDGNRNIDNRARSDIENDVESMRMNMEQKVMNGEEQSTTAEGQYELSLSHNKSMHIFTNEKVHCFNLKLNKLLSLIALFFLFTILSQ
jgi:hypothetical protein